MMQIGMSTSCTFPSHVADAFRVAEACGFDGVEVMVSNESATQRAAELLALSHNHRLPVLAIHAPVLLYTQFVWGRDPAVKLRRSAELAADTGAGTVVVHPPFRWQSHYARDFLSIVADTAQQTGVEIAVENMFPWRVRSRTFQAYQPSWNPLDFACDAVTLDFSHAALSGLDALATARALGPRLRHVHLTDGHGAQPGKDRIFDEHLVPGDGGQPVAEVLQWLNASGWNGSVVAEINTRHAADEGERLQMLRRTLDFFHTNASSGPDPIVGRGGTSKAP